MKRILRKRPARPPSVSDTDTDSSKSINNDSDDESFVVDSKKPKKRRRLQNQKDFKKGNQNGSNDNKLNNIESTNANSDIIDDETNKIPTPFDGNQSSRRWQVHELLAHNENIDSKSAENIIRLFREENTIPFICRYRRDMISNTITPEKLRDIKNTYEEILNIKKRAQTILVQLEKDNVLTNEICDEILAAKTMEDLEFLYSPYKPANKGSLADRAKACGLDKPAEHILYGKSPAFNDNDLIKLINISNPNADTKDKVIQGICYVISHIFSKSTEVLEEMRRLEKSHYIVLKSTGNKSSSSSSSSSKVKGNKNDYNKENERRKYENYFAYEIPIKYIKPHQVLAINRGEKCKYLSVKIIIPEELKFQMKDFIRQQFLSHGLNYNLRFEIFQKSFEECYTKKLQPLLIRQIRSNLTETAKKASIDVFAKNLKQLLLMTPLKGEKILGIDPGFSNGCKLALISETAEVLDSAVIYPHTHHDGFDKSALKLRQMLSDHNCNIIALGNGKACRNTEMWLTSLFEKGHLDQNKIRYSIVSEQGASVYSCSDVAKKEFPTMDVNLISAVSIARRLNDPLSEYVKIEPRHIGVGMYQHDINEKILTESLNEVVSECVSFVGVDVNTASLSILKHIAGLGESKAQKIIEHRNKCGIFKSRKDLLKVKSIGEKTFTQCAGFIRIEPLSVGGSVSNLLDCTWVHPESYQVAEKIMKKCKLMKTKIGQPEFIEVIKAFAVKCSLEELEKEMKTPKERIATVLEALQRELFQDYRADVDKKPLFKQGITEMSSLKEGCIVTGAVTNVTNFGAFVDIGVEKDGLIHTSKMGGMILNIGDRIEAIVQNIDAQRGRIQLKFENYSI